MSRIWAQPTWYFFHTFAEKINKKFYESNQGMCFNIIRQICFNLPCPECRKHATNYISKISLHSVKTKEDLIFILFTFHNDVNRRLGKRLFTWDELNMYKRAKTISIFKLFLNRFGISFAGRRFTAWTRNRITGDLQNWLAKYWKYFT